MEELSDVEDKHDANPFDVDSTVLPLMFRELHTFPAVQEQGLYSRVQTEKISCIQWAHKETICKATSNNVPKLTNFALCSARQGTQFGATPS